MFVFFKFHYLLQLENESTLKNFPHSHWEVLTTNYYKTADHSKGHVKKMLDAHKK